MLRAIVMLGAWATLATLCFVGYLDSAELNSARKQEDNYEYIIPSLLHDSFDGHRRTKRSVSATDDNVTTSDETVLARRLVYKILAFGHNFTLLLYEDVDDLPPSVIVERRFHNHSSRSVYNAFNSTCLYHGSIASESASDVLISLCPSMLGIIRTSTESFAIEPLLTQPENSNSNSDPRSIHGQVHKMYRLANMHLFNGSSGVYADFTDDYRHEHKRQQGSRQRDRRPKATPATPRNKRLRRAAISWDRYVETLVVADNKMARFYGNELVHYVLTLMSIVSSIYRDPSLGNSIKITTMKILVLEDELAGPKVTANAISTLKNFCAWQYSQNTPDDASPLHYDTAILLTRQDICRAQRKCDTLGLAELGSVCDTRRSCAIVEENGLSAAFTMAHELGHVFNLPHDDDPRCDMFPDHKKGGYHIMASTLDYLSDPWSWSACSAHWLTDFMATGQGECLLDEPVVTTYDNMIDDKLPGERYDVNTQCEQVFGAEAKICPYMPACKRLWCTSPHVEEKGCRTLHMPWAEGTSCGTNKWCRKGDCVEKQVFQPVDGGWSRWSPYGSCSRTCGGGVMKATRHCINPVPKFGGKYCVGLRVRYRSCNTQDCPVGSRDFRDVQCAQHNGMHFNIDGLNTDVQWIAKYTGGSNRDRCKLYCRVPGTTAYYLLGDKVTDGTKCSLDSSDVCVSGLCRRAGCDNQLGSSAKRDVCGVCNGDGSSCQQITGNVTVPVRYGYNSILWLPAGAMAVDIRQTATDSRPDNNYLAIRDGEGRYVLNGNFVVSVAVKEVMVYGGVMEYSGSNSITERLNSTKKFDRPLEILVLSVGKLYPPQIVYSYIVPRDSQPIAMTYYWFADTAWTDCSFACQGTRRQRVMCKNSANHTVADSYCDRQEKLAERITSCNHHCTLAWHVAEESECSSRCGPGMVQRRVKCLKRMTSSSKYVGDEQCSHVASRPDDMVPCEGRCGEGRWSYGDWSQCSVTCGWGVQKRQAQCLSDTSDVLPDDRCTGERDVLQKCHLHTCPTWDTGDWSKCSVTCDMGTKSRSVWCQVEGAIVSDELCSKSDEPVKAMSCYGGECPFWQTGGWSECSASCGGGMERRVVKCLTTSGQFLDDTSCAEEDRPLEERLCQAAPCFQAMAAFGPVAITNNPRHMATTTSDVIAEWRTGGWTVCSPSCGTGMRERLVSCLTADERVVEHKHCSHAPRPASREKCQGPPCGQWRTGHWTECSATCGVGRESRYVACIVVDLGGDPEVVSASQCATSAKPDEWRQCSRTPCASVAAAEPAGSAGGAGGSSSSSSSSAALLAAANRPQWTTGQWSECSVTCGGGQAHRSVKCVSSDGELVFDAECHMSTKPISTQRCHRRVCPEHRVRWVRGRWSSISYDRMMQLNKQQDRCANGCMAGKRTAERNVTCQDGAGNSLPAAHCSRLRTPRVSRPCKRQPADCFHWKPLSAWSKCPTNVTCGEETVKLRRVACVLRLDGNIVDDTRCTNATRPPHTVPCPRSTSCHTYSTSSNGSSRNRTLTSCKDISTLTQLDGEYVISVQHNKLMVFCSGMNTASPAEYLTLPFGENENYAEIFTRPPRSKCSANDTPHERVRCARRPAARRLAHTAFSRIRVHPGNLTVDVSDVKFGKSRGRPVPYASILPQCRSTSGHVLEGKFRIDLRQTSLQIAPNVVWNGTRALYISKDRQVAFGIRNTCDNVVRPALQLQFISPS